VVSRNILAGVKKRSGDYVVAGEDDDVVAGGDDVVAGGDEDEESDVLSVTQVIEKGTYDDEEVNKERGGKGKEGTQ
jgi:hypothetical protein